jgi:CHAT domain-containing protein
MASGRNALVIGDPPSDYPPLPGAAEEALRVRAMLLQHGFEVAGNEPGSTPADILNLLFDRPWRILHVAAHGVYRDGESGIVIGPGQVLTGVQIRAMREVPEFVFLNCCHLGKMGVRGEEMRREMPMFAGNVARQFIRAGVKAVVVAGWEVRDDAALVFADVMYEGLLEGVPLGQCVRGAASVVYSGFAETSSAQAYQCYGEAAMGVQR